MRHTRHALTPLLLCALLASCATDPHQHLRVERLLDTVEALSAIGAYAGWRNSASEGEREAIAWMEEALAPLEVVDVEVESFQVPVGMELRESRLHLRVDGRWLEVPANALRLERLDSELALRSDTDGALDDRDPDPVERSGPIQLALERDALLALRPEDTEGAVLVLAYDLIDWSVHPTDRVREHLHHLYTLPSEAIVLITRFDDRLGHTHAAFIGDMPPLAGGSASSPRSVLYARTEDLPEGARDLEGADAARVRLDIDVVAPARSANLIARIAGEDSSRAVILGAHIDSPNSPGALDDGSGSAILLEIARAYDESGATPPVDLLLVWFGAEELGLYGSTHFVMHHQELLDRTVGMLQIDGLTRPVSGVEARLSLRTWSAERFDIPDTPWPTRVQAAARARGVELDAATSFTIYSDNNSFVPFGVPNTELMYLTEPVEIPGSAHYASHVHSPYDTPERVAEVADVFEQMAHVALAATLAPPDARDNRPTPTPTHRALFIASHAEAAAFSLLQLSDLGLALAAQGFDVDLVPPGEPLTDDHLEGVDLALTLPSTDHATALNPDELHLPDWTPEERDTLARYVDRGGLVILTFSPEIGGFGMSIANEDLQRDIDLARHLGASPRDALAVARLTGPPEPATSSGSGVAHPLLDGLSRRQGLSSGDALVTFELGDDAHARALVTVNEIPHAIALSRGEGELLLFGHVHLLATSERDERNIPLLRNLARYAAERAERRR